MVVVMITEITARNHAEYLHLAPVTLPLRGHQEGLLRIASKPNRFVPLLYCIHVHPLWDSRKEMVRVQRSRHTGNELIQTASEM